MPKESIGTEHARLRAGVEQLQREHDSLQKDPRKNAAAHAEHKAKLRGKIADLRAHIDRLKRRGGAA